jgi:redox-sensitive bicupin YhaK (pirin superfamily)
LIKIIASEYDNIKGAVQKPYTLPQFLDLHFQNTQEHKTEFVYSIHRSKNAFLYVYEGSIEIGDERHSMTVTEGHMAILDNKGDFIKAFSKLKAKAILIAGEPLNEPIEQYGPFVMNTREEIIATIKEYQSGEFQLKTKETSQLM